MSQNLSYAFNEIKSEKKIIFDKICKYYVYIGVMELFEKIKFNRNNMIKKYKIKLMKDLKNITEFNS